MSNPTNAFRSCLPQLFRGLRVTPPVAVPRHTFKAFKAFAVPAPFRPTARRGLVTSALTNAREQPVDWPKVGVSAALAAGSVVAANYALNRETRGALTAAESSYLHETFAWTGAGLGITGVTARMLHKSGQAARLMQLNPWVFMGVGLALSVGSMMAVFATAPDSTAHYAAWATFSALQGVTLSPLFFLNPAILSRAAIYTGGALIPLVYVGCTAENSTFMYAGGALLAGLGIVIASSLAPMLLPRMGARTMSTLEHVSAYGGVAVFSGLILYDTQKILNHATMAERGQLVRDPVRESVSLILDVINLFVKMVQVLMLQQRKK